MKASSLTALLVSTSSLFGALASAAPTPPPRPSPPAPDARKAPPPTPTSSACPVATGAIAFEADARPLGNIDPAKASAKVSEQALYDNGAWTRRELKDGKLAQVAMGCLDRDTLARAQADLKAATWKTKKYEVTCAAIGVSQTVYTARGKQVFIDVTCGAYELDATSRASLEDLNKIFAAVLVPSPAPR